MSYIDTFNHSHIGSFFGIPVYHPFNNAPLSELHSDMIVLGGGSGEHNMFILDGINEIVIETLDHFYGENVISVEILKKYGMWENSVEWKSQWSIEESYDVFYDMSHNNTSSLFETYKTKSAEKIVLLTVGLYLLNINAEWVDNELLNLDFDTSVLPDTLILPVSRNELSGRYFLDSRPINGISYNDEMKILNNNSIN